MGIYASSSHSKTCSDMEIQIEEQGEFLLDSMKNAWDDYDSDETDLMSAEDTMSDEYSEPEVDPKDKKTN